MHAALAEATDPAADPDRRPGTGPRPRQVRMRTSLRSWSVPPGRAQGRGGLAAAGAFLERAALLTPDPVRRAHRLLPQPGPNAELVSWMRRWGCWSRPRPDRWTRARPRRWKACAVRSPLTNTAAATRSGCCSAQPGDSSRSMCVWPARRTWRRSEPRSWPAIWAARRRAEAAEAARAAPPGPDPPRPVDVVLDALTLRLTEGHAAAAATLTRALERLLPWTPAGEARRCALARRRESQPHNRRWSCGTSSPGMRWPPARFRPPASGRVRPVAVRAQLPLHAPPARRRAGRSGRLSKKIA